MRRVIFFCCLILLLGSDTLRAQPGDGAVQPEKYYVWKFSPGDSTGFYHRLPNLLVTDKGSILAYSDARLLTSRADGAPSHVVLKRSTDGGKTWSPPQFLGYSDKGQNFLFSVGIQDRISKNIFFFYCMRTEKEASASEVFVRTSSDDGISWGQPVSVTGQLVKNDSLLKERLLAGETIPGFTKQSAGLLGRKLFVTGPGTAIQLRGDHALYPNRLVIPVFGMKDRWGKMEQRGYGNTILYSDDQGKTWKAGGITPLGNYSSSELTIAEQDNGDLLMNARVAAEGFTNWRTMSVSKDGGMTWSVPELFKKFPPSIRTGNGMAVLNFSSEDRAGRSRLLYSFPNDSTKRRNNSMALSYDDGKTWPVIKTIQADQSYYSNVAVTADKKILVIYASGEAEGNDVILARFDLHWLTNGKDSIRPVQPAASIKRSVLWERGADSVKEHFVYGLEVTTRGTVLCFAEGRIETDDESPHHIVLKRSADGGATWQAQQILVRSNGTECYANPTPVVDKATGNVYLFYARNYANDYSNIFYMVSADDGNTWGRPHDITRLFDNDVIKRPFHLPGPGHGIQLKNGRLLLQVWHRFPVNLPVKDRQYGVSFIYSDDHGHTWKSAGHVPQSPEFPLNESRIVETNDSVLLFGRYASTGTFRRIFSASGDGGLTWTEPRYSTLDAFTSVDAGLNIEKNKQNSSGRILITRPIDSSARKDLAISLSEDGGKTWPYTRIIQEGPANYSDIAVMPDGSVFVLYGCGAPRYVAVAKFTSDWIKQSKQMK